MSIHSEINKSCTFIFNCQQELKQIWYAHLTCTKSAVLCEIAGGLSQVLFRNPFGGYVKVDIAATTKNYKVFANTNNNKTTCCNCPGVEPGKIPIDSSRHLHSCPVRKRITSGKYTVDTTISTKIGDGNSLGVVING